VRPHTAASQATHHDDAIGVALRFIAAETELLAQRCIQLLAKTIDTRERLQAIVERAKLADEWIRRLLAERLTNGEGALIVKGDTERIISLMRAASALTPGLEADIASLRKDLDARLYRLERQLLVFGKGDQYRGVLGIAMAIGMSAVTGSAQLDIEGSLQDPHRRAQALRKLLSPALWQLIAASDHDAFVAAAEALGGSGFMRQMAQAIDDYYQNRGREIWPNGD